MKIRSVERKDLGSVVDLCSEHARFEQAIFDPANKVDLLDDQLFGEVNVLKCLVAEIDDDIVGYATFMKQFSTWEADYYVYLDCLYLKENTRGLGIGHQMMDRLKAYARSENCQMIQWQTPDFNIKAIQFYQRLGAESKFKQRFFWKV